MEEEKAAAYYDELTRKGEGAARFKQGLGFSSSSSSSSSSSFTTTFVPASSSSSSSSSSFTTTFVPASSSSYNLQRDTSESQYQKNSDVLNSIQNKLSKSKPTDHDLGQHPRRSRDEGKEDGNGYSKSRGRYRDEHEHSYSRRHDRHRSSSRERDGRDRDRRRRHRSRSRDERRSPASDGEGARRRRSSSPRSGRSERDRGHRVEDRTQKMSSKERNAGGVIDYARLIDGYDKMTPAERVKAKMKLQLSETVANDTVKGSGWERFDFNKEAPLDDEEIEVAEDDAALVKDLGQSFRFSAVEAKREAEIKAAHDEAIFGTAAALPIMEEKECNEEKDVKESVKPSTNLMSDKVLAMQQGSWRDRARKLWDGSNS